MYAMQQNEQLQYQQRLKQQSLVQQAMLQQHQQQQTIYHAGLLAAMPQASGPLPPLQLLLSLLSGSVCLTPIFRCSCFWNTVYIVVLSWSGSRYQIYIHCWWCVTVRSFGILLFAQVELPCGHVGNTLLLELPRWSILQNDLITALGYSQESLEV